MAYSRYIVFERAVILLIATAACALVTMVVGVGMFHLGLPPSDEAYGKPWFTVEVRAVTGPLCMVCAAITYPVMLWGLLRTNLLNPADSLGERQRPASREHLKTSQS